MNPIQNRMCWYLALAAVEDDEEVQKNGLVEVLIANDTLTKQKSITEHLSQGFAGLLCLPIRFVGIHFCYDNVIFHPILKLAQMVFGAGNRLRFRVHNGRSNEGLSQTFVSLLCNILNSQSFSSSYPSSTRLPP